MTCRELTDFLTEYLEGTTPAPARAAFAAHLAECEDCVAYVDAYRETVRLGRGAFADPDAPVPDAIPEALVRAVLAARRTTHRDGKTGRK